MPDTSGTWIVANPDWIDGPGLAVPYADEISALRAANDAGWRQRAWFVPHGIDLRDVMIGDWKPQSPASVEPDPLLDNAFDVLLAHLPLWDSSRCACGVHIAAPEGDRGLVWVTHVMRQITSKTEKENRNA